MTALIVAARRTPVVRAGKQYAHLGAEQLSALVIDALLDQLPAPVPVEHVFWGNAAGPGGNIARVSALASRLGTSVPATSMDAQCASSLEAIAAGCRLVATGEARAVIAGGVESVSTAPWRMTKPATPMEQPVVYSRARFTPRPMPDPDMGVAAENIAQRYGITREAQDEFALRSHQRAVGGAASGRFDSELVPVAGVGGMVERDSCPRAQLTLEKLAALRPAFVPDGTVTAGNACPINDGAAGVLILHEELAHSLNLTRALEYVAAGHGACDPELLGMAAVPAMQKLRSLLGVAQDWSPHLLEFNEAFAAQVLACFTELGLDPLAANRDGGALALGHPYGASGAILATRLWSQAAEANEGDMAVALMAGAGGTGTALGLRVRKFRG
ncbi:thiolase family protein [Glutamicibacter endophyticus]